jgi:hypothetical protein
MPPNIVTNYIELNQPHCKSQFHYETSYRNIKEPEIQSQRWIPITVVERPHAMPKWRRPALRHQIVEEPVYTRSALGPGAQSHKWRALRRLVIPSRIRPLPNDQPLPFEPLESMYRIRRDMKGFFPPRTRCA